MTTVARAPRAGLVVLAAVGCALSALTCSSEPLVYVGTKARMPVAGNSTMSRAGSGAAGEGEEHEGSGGDDHEDAADEHEDESDSDNR